MPVRVMQTTRLETPPRTVCWARDLFRPITINGSGNNAITLDDSGVATPAIVPCDPYKPSGAASGDKLFGVGGVLNYSGGHIAFALDAEQQHRRLARSTCVRAAITTAMTISGNNPATSCPGDSMTVATANATNTQFVPNGTGAGQYTFANRMAVTFSGVEQVATDAVAPLVTGLGATPQFNVIPLGLSFGFSELLSGAPPLSAFSATSQSAIPVPFSGVTFTGNVATVSISGALADGNYQGILKAGGVVDQPGNSMSANYGFDFFSLSGDANHDRFVNTMDFTALAQNFGAVNVGSSKGDFNYDGKVNALDFNILATKFGAHLLASAPATVISSAMPSAASAPADTSSLANLFSTKPIDSASTSECTRCCGQLAQLLGRRICRENPVPDYHGVSSMHFIPRGRIWDSTEDDSSTETQTDDFDPRHPRVRSTFAGDFNLDGTVNTIDFTIMAANFNKSGIEFPQCDANFDGVVNRAGLQRGCVKLRADCLCRRFVVRAGGRESRGALGINRAAHEPVHGCADQVRLP